jgi:hypothetical protein
MNKYLGDLSMRDSNAHCRRPKILGLTFSPQDISVYQPLPYPPPSEGEPHFTSSSSEDASRLFTLTTLVEKNLACYCCSCICE